MKETKRIFGVWSNWMVAVQSTNHEMHCDVRHWTPFQQRVFQGWKVFIYHNIHSHYNCSSTRFPSCYHHYSCFLLSTFPQHHPESRYLQLRSSPSTQFPHLLCHNMTEIFTLRLLLHCVWPLCRCLFLVSVCISTKREYEFFIEKLKNSHPVRSSK